MHCRISHSVCKFCGGQNRQSGLSLVGFNTLSSYLLQVKSVQRSYRLLKKTFLHQEMEMHRFLKKGPNYARCTMCTSDFSIGHVGSNDVQYGISRLKNTNQPLDFGTDIHEFRRPNFFFKSAVDVATYKDVIVREFIQHFNTSFLNVELTATNELIKVKGARRPQKSTATYQDILIMSSSSLLIEHFQCGVTCSCNNN